MVFIIIVYVTSCVDHLNFSFRAYRTAICKAKRGGFKDTHPEDLLAPVLKVSYLLDVDSCMDFLVLDLSRKHE